MNIDECCSTTRAVFCVVMMGALAGCAGKPAATGPQISPAQQAAQPASVEPADARKVLMRMADFLSSTPKFSVTLTDTYDVLQESGQKIEFGDIRKIIVSRPNGLRVEVEHSDGEKHLMLYDGKDITAFSPSHNVYAQASKPGGIDEAIMHFLRDLHMRLPLAVLLLSRFPDEIERRTETLDYVERTSIAGKPAHHLAGRTETVDYQIWVAEGVQPLPLRAVLTYKNADGQPVFRAQFSDWNLTPEIKDGQFTFSPPNGAEKIAFLAQLPQFELQGAPIPEKSGGKK